MSPTTKCINLMPKRSANHYRYFYIFPAMLDQIIWFENNTLKSRTKSGDYVNCITVDYQFMLNY